MISVSGAVNTISVPPPAGAAGGSVTTSLICPPCKTLENTQVQVLALQTPRHEVLGIGRQTSWEALVWVSVSPRSQRASGHDMSWPASAFGDRFRQAPLPLAGF